MVGITADTNLRKSMTYLESEKDSIMRVNGCDTAEQQRFLKDKAQYREVALNWSIQNITNPSYFTSGLEHSKRLQPQGDSS